MPFMKGTAPIRRTLKYLNAGRIVLKDRVKIFTLNFNSSGDNHKGAKEFSLWCLPQIQYKNPSVQVLSLRDTTPTPFIRVFLDDGTDVVVDVDNKESDEIQDMVRETLCKTSETLAKELKAEMQTVNPANIGFGCRLNCICRVAGQIPCPAMVQLPNHMRGKYLFFDRD